MPKKIIIRDQESGDVAEVELTTIDSSFNKNSIIAKIFGAIEEIVKYNPDVNKLEYYDYYNQENHYTIDLLIFWAKFVDIPVDSVLLRAAESIFNQMLANNLPKKIIIRDQESKDVVEIELTAVNGSFNKNLASAVAKISGAIDGMVKHNPEINKLEYYDYCNQKNQYTFDLLIFWAKFVDIPVDSVLLGAANSILDQMLADITY